MTESHSRLGTEILELTASGGSKSFFVHKNLIVAQSAFLRASVDTAATDRKYDLESWDSDTVGYLVNFLYLHTYATGEPEPLSSIVESTASDTTGTQSRANTPDTVCSGSTIQPGDSLGETGPRPLTPLSGLRGELDNVDGGCPVVAERSYAISHPQETHDYHSLLLAHGKVYALARSLHVDSLAGMAYQRLLAILDILQPITPGSHTARSVVELLRYVYADTEVTEDRMRKLVSQFTALNLPAMQGLEEMEGQLRGGGQLVVDLMEKVCRRMVASEEALDKSSEIACEMAAGDALVREELRVERERVMVLESKIEGMQESWSAAREIIPQLWR